jgi:hypothetical protein
MKALLDRVQKEAESDASVANIRMVAMLSTQWREMLRNMGLTLQPSRSVVRTIASDRTTEDPRERLIKIGPDS